MSIREVQQWLYLSQIKEKKPNIFEVNVATLSMKTKASSTAINATRSKIVHIFHDIISDASRQKRLGEGGGINLWRWH